MTVIDVLNQPWAITPEMLETMHAVYERHQAGVSFDAESIKAMFGDQGDGGSDAPYTVQDGVAVIPVDGVLAKKMNLFTAISGGMSTEILTDAVNQAIADPMVHSILLAIDSPGGEVDGTQQIGNAVAASTKPTMAWVNGMACSAAYWIAAQCDSIYADSDTAQVGSISVIVKHVDQSKANEKSGKAITYITSGKYKAIAHGDAPLSPDGKDYLQERVDYLNTLFVGAVAEGLGMSPDDVWSSMGEGRVFFAQQAIAVGMIDGIASQADCIAKLNNEFLQQQNPGAQPSANPFSGATTMFRSFATEADFNAVMLAEFERGKASVSTTISAAVLEQARAEGATAERERIQAVEGVMLAGHGDLISKLKFDGKTTGPEAAAQVIAAERTIRGEKLDALAKDAPVVIPPTAPDAAAEKAAQERRDAGLPANKPATNDPKDVKAIGDKIEAHIASEKAAGRKVGYAEAASFVESQTAK